MVRRENARISYRNILISHMLLRLGDMVCTMALIREIKKGYPDALPQIS